MFYGHPLTKNKPAVFFRHRYSKVLTGDGDIKNYAQLNGIFLPQTGEFLMLAKHKQTAVFLVCKLPQFGY